MNRPTVHRDKNGGYAVRWEREDGAIFTEKNGATNSSDAWFESISFFAALGCEMSPSGLSRTTGE